jgi:hypothetical protein
MSVAPNQADIVAMIWSTSNMNYHGEKGVMFGGFFTFIFV